ncbi:MAG: sporulation protein YqfD [Clostridia bacterium]|nr:sporulation protein YqfD [Clostridia bacterium]
MLAETIRDLLSGRVVFSAEGGFPELFMEECAVRRVPLRNVERGTGSVRATVDERGFRQVGAAAEKAGMAVRAKTRAGLPYLLYRYRRRIGIPIGVMLAAALLIQLSGRLWEVTVTGNETLNDDEILDVMEEAGVKTGVLLRQIDVKDAEQTAQNLLPQLSWIAVNVIGCKALVEVREIIPRPEMTDETDYADLVAAQDGLIVRADVLEGAGQPKIGEPVVKGDLLVSGTIEMNNGFRRYVNAKAIILAETRSTLTAAVSKQTSAERIVRSGTVWSVRFFGITVPFGFLPKDAERETSSFYVKSRRTVFPIGVSRTRWCVCETMPVEWEEGMAALVCFARFCENAADRYRDAEVLRMEVTSSEEAREAKVTAAFRCVEPIAVRQPFIVDREGESAASEIERKMDKNG